MNNVLWKTMWSDCNGSKQLYPVRSVAGMGAPEERRFGRARPAGLGVSLLTAILLLGACTGMQSSQKTAPASPSLPVTADVSAVRAELLAIADAWDKAIVAKDRAGIEKNMADDFMQIPASGSIVTRKEFIDGVMSPDLRIEPYRVEDLDVRVFGDSALLTGHIDMRGISEGQSFRQHFRYMDIYARRQGRWQIVAMQITPIRAARPDTAPATTPK